MSITNSEVKGLPDWTKDTFDEYFSDVQSLVEVIGLSVQGASMIQAFPSLVRSLPISKIKPCEGEDSDTERKRLEAVDYLASLAQAHQDSGFSTIYGQAVVSLWSAVEDFIKNFIGRWLINVPQTRLDPPWSELKVRVGEYESLDEAQKAYFLLGIVEQNTGAALKSGIGRFERLLETLHLSGPVNDEVRAKLYEMQQVRNVIAHRRGVADAKFCKACPDFGISIGEKLSISEKHWNAYRNVVDSYVTEIGCRTGEKFGDSNIRQRVQRALTQHSIVSSNIMSFML